MRPIDTIRRNIDSDLTKYHSSNLCTILTDDDIKNIKGVGILAKVYPIRDLDTDSLDNIKPEEARIVLIINRPYGWLEGNISQKFNVLTLSMVVERMGLAVGFFISKGIFDEMAIFNVNESEDMKPRDVDGNSVISKTVEFLTTDS